MARGRGPRRVGRSPVIQRRAARRLSHIYVAYPPGPLARPDGARGMPIPGQRVPDVQVRSGGRATTLHTALRSGRHVLVVPAADTAGVRGDPALRPYWADLDVVTGDIRGEPGLHDRGPGPVALVRPDGHLAARGRPGHMQTITGYLCDLFTESADRRSHVPPADGALHAVSGTATGRLTPDMLTRAGNPTTSPP